MGINLYILVCRVQNKNWKLAGHDGWPKPELVGHFVCLSGHLYYYDKHMHSGWKLQLLQPGCAYYTMHSDQWLVYRYSKLIVNVAVVSRTSQTLPPLTPLWLTQRYVVDYCSCTHCTVAVLYYNCYSARTWWPTKRTNEQSILINARKLTDGRPLFCILNMYIVEFTDTTCMPLCWYLVNSPCKLWVPRQQMLLKK